jgi:hypothetical protein
MALRVARGLFRLWIVGTALFVIIIAFVSYSDIKAQFDAVASDEAAVSSMLAANTTFADEVYKSFYSDMPREQFDKRITSANPMPELVARLKTTVTHLDTSRSLSEWTNDELLAVYLYPPAAAARNPWATVGQMAVIAFGIPLAVLVLGASLVWAFAGFSAKRT